MIAPRRSQPDRALLRAWLLLLLARADAHGWALMRGLRAQGIAVEASLGYRLLRDLERTGAVSSYWTRSDAGPPRRSYRMTDDGRRALADQAAGVRAAWMQHDAFARAHGGGAERAGDGASSAAGGGRAAAAGARRELVAAWVLLLLQAGAAHGYGLLRALEERDVHADPAALYRVLRQLDRAGWIQSRWMKPARGPRRRLYRIAPGGRRNLGELALMLAAIRDDNAAFLRAYDRAPSG